MLKMQVCSILLKGMPGEDRITVIFVIVSPTSKIYLSSLQTGDWKRWHKNECGMLKAVWKSCPSQETTFARLFVRNGLEINVSIYIYYDLIGIK